MTERIGAALRDAVLESRQERKPVPTVGSYGTPNAEALASYQANDPSARLWVSLYYWPDSSDKAEPWFGPVVDENEYLIRLDLGHEFPTSFLKRFCVIRRAS